MASAARTGILSRNTTRTVLLLKKKNYSSECVSMAAFGRCFPSHKGLVNKGLSGAHSSSQQVLAAAEVATTSEASEDGNSQASTSAVSGGEKLLEEQGAKEGSGDAALGSSSEGAEENVEVSDGDVSDEGYLSDDPEMEKGYKMSKICDRLIVVFADEKNDPQEWRKLLAYSKDWAKIRPYFYKRCKEVAAKEEDPARKAQLFKLARKVKEVDEDMERHNDLFRAVEEAEDVNTVVTYRRKEFTTDFFDHLELMAKTSYQNPERVEEIYNLATLCLAAVNSHDQFMADADLMESSKKKLEDVLNSPDLQTACGKIDDMANRNELDSHFMLMLTKAWAASTRDSDYNKDDVKEIMYSLYLTGVKNMQRMFPKEIRILKHLMTLDDPRQLYDEMVAAFSPGAELETDSIDYLYTTPEDLLRYANKLLELFDMNKKSSSVEINKMVDPSVVNKLVVIRDLVKKDFM